MHSPSHIRLSPLLSTHFTLKHDDLVGILAESKTPVKGSNCHGNHGKIEEEAAANLQFDITHDDLAQILAENKTPIKQPKRPGAIRSVDSDVGNPLVSPATSQEIIAFVEAATSSGGMRLAQEYGGDGATAQSASGGRGAVAISSSDIDDVPKAAESVHVALLSALDVILGHQSLSLLSLRDIGRLASCCKRISNVVAEAPIWRQLFERAAKSGRPYRALPGSAANLADKYEISTVCGEDRLLSCFANPTATVINAVGWKKAASCLLSKTCANCGALCALANPITWTRTCRTCALSDPSSYLINKTNAKLFLLSDSDLNKLRGATYEKQFACKKECNSTLHLLSEVMAASYKKYIDADGLAAEIARRRAAALERYERSQSTSKPQKKRPRIERMSDRPGENSRRIIFADGGLPIGTCVDLESCAMHHSVICRYCSAMGSVVDIVLHERVVHSKLGVI